VDAPGGVHEPPAVAPAAPSVVATSEPTTNARGAIELIGLVVAPTTLITALAFYFGWVMTNARSSYFGIDASALGYSTQDYLLRSTDALFVPLGTVIVTALVAVWLHGVATRQLIDPDSRARLRLAAGVAAGTGGVLFVLGLFATFTELPLSPHPLFEPASPGIGIAVLAYGLHMLGRARAAEQPPVMRAADRRSRAMSVVLVALLIVLSAFWTASDYAKALGQGRAEAIAVGRLPLVTVFAPKRLDIRADGVDERRLTGSELAYRYRYAGLRLLVRAGGNYFLLPDGWTPSRGAAIVLGDRPEYRFEFEYGANR